MNFKTASALSADTLASPRMFARLRETSVVPYDLVIFDEAHKLAADRGNDLRVRKTDRYCLAEAIAGVQAGNAAGMRVIAITTSYPAPILAEHNPAAIIASFTDLAQPCPAAALIETVTGRRLAIKA